MEGESFVLCDPPYLCLQLSAVRGQKKQLERQVTSLQRQKARAEDLKKAHEEQKRLEQQVQSLVEESQSLSRQLSQAHEVACLASAAHGSVCGQLVRETEANAMLHRSIAVLEERRQEIDQSHSEVLDCLRAEARDSDQLREDLVAELTRKMESLAQEHAQENREYEEQLAALHQVHQRALEERELVREELRSMHGMVEQETESLRFQLSTTKMKLEQTIKVRSLPITHPVVVPAPPTLP